MQKAVILTEEQKDEFESVVLHPIQSWYWGEFKRSVGAAPERIGLYEKGKMIAGFQIIFSKLPKTNLTIGLLSRCGKITPEVISVLKILAKKHNSIFIKVEPLSNFPILNDKDDAGAAQTNFDDEVNFLKENGACPGKPFFEKYNFILDISKTEEELMNSFHTKTRYNIRLAEKKGVTIIDNTSEEGVADYVRLMEETTKRQGFFNHNAAYFYKLFNTFPKDKIRIFEAVYNNEVLTAWILFKFNGNLYYPYGASSNTHREVMPNNLIMWKAIQYGKAHNCSTFDLWGCLGPSPDTADSWYGFHKFKAGYKPQLIEYIGTYDFVYRPVLYKVFGYADKIRWKILKLKRN